MYQTHYNKITTALNIFAGEIERMRTDAEAYSKQPNASERALHFKRAQIEIFAGIHDAVADYKAATDDVVLETERKLALAQETIFKLEGICLLHGIYNIGDYMRRSAHELGTMVQQAYADGWRQTPAALPQWDEGEARKLRRDVSIALAAIRKAA